MKRTKDHVPLGFKTVPHFENYAASPFGKIYCKNGFYPSTSTFPTSKGEYITCSVVSSDTGVRQDIVIHRLIALAYHYPGDNWQDLDVNHLDGDKLNNNANNLEWCTKGENLKHAYDTGLRKDHRHFIVYDDEKSVVCKSMNDAALHMGVDFDVAEAYVPIQACLDRRLMNRWKVILDDSHTPVINREKQATDITCFNPITGQEIIVKTIFEAAMVVNQFRGTINYRLNNQDKPRPLNGWLVWRTKDNLVKIPEYTQEEITKSIEEAKSRALKSLLIWEDKIHRKENMSTIE